MRWLLAILLLCGCSSNKPAPKTSGPPPSCANGCMNEQSACTDKCLENEEHAEGEESCAERCQKTADECNAHCH